MQQAIATKVLPCTNTLPTRIKAQCERGSLVVSWDDAFNPEQNHRRAAEQLVAKFLAEDAKRWGDTSKSGWARPMVSGALKDCYVHVFVPFGQTVNS